MTIQEFINKVKDKYNFANPFPKIVLGHLDIDKFLMLEQISAIAMGIEGEIASDKSDGNDRIATLKELAQLVDVNDTELEAANEITLLKFAILATLEILTTKMDEERQKKMEDLVPKLAKTFGNTFTYALELAISNLEEGSDEG